MVVIPRSFSLHNDTQIMYALLIFSPFRRALTFSFQGLVDTVIFHIDAITGADITRQSKDGAVFEGLDIIQGPLVEGYLLNAETKVVVLLDEFLQVHCFFSSMLGLILTFA